jgi:NADH-quinone oxidoreductase subunit J
MQSNMVLSSADMFLSSATVLASEPLFSPVLILVLCLIAGIATVFMLPGHREATIRKVSGVALVAVGLIFLASVPSWIPDGAGKAPAMYFWIFSAIAIAAALRVVTHPKPVYSALYFVLTVFASAGLFVLLQAEFMAAALVIIYAGAILVTYVFVIMLASQATSDGTVLSPMADYDSHSREPAAAAAIGFALMGVLMFVIFDKADQRMEPAGPVPLIASSDGAPAPMPIKVSGATQELGMFLFQHQLLQLELAGIILLVSMVGAIIISRRRVHMHASTLAAIEKAETVAGPATPVDDNPHSVPVYGSEVRRVKVPS